MEITKEEAERFLKEKVFKLEDPDSMTFNICDPRILVYKSKMSVNIQGGKLAIIEGALREATHSNIVGIRATYMSGDYINYRWEQCCYLEIDKINRFNLEKFGCEYAKLYAIELAIRESLDGFLVIKLDDEKFTAFYLTK